MGTNNIDTEDGIKFTVIIPAYNAEKTIERYLDSVIGQSYPAYEIIVVDDASVDKTRHIIHEKYKDRVTCKEKLFNAGSSVARNTGMNDAKGGYIAFLDADDAWHPDKLLLINTILLSKPGIHLFYHPFTQDDILNRSLPEDIVVYKLPFVKLLPANLIATSCAVIKNSPEFRFEATMRHTEDFDLWLRIGYKYGLHFIKIPLTRIFRPFTSAGGISENKWAMRKGEMKAYSRLVKLNPLFLFLLPFLITGSLGKHIIKKIIKTH